MQQLTGPNNCAECGTDTPIEVYRAGDAGQLVIEFNGELIEIPGLAICTDCAGSIMVGEREPAVTPERAVEFLTTVYLPRLAEHMTMAQNAFAMAYSRAKDCAGAARKLDPELNIQIIEIDMDDLEGL